MLINDTVTVNCNGTDGAKLQGSSTETGTTHTTVDTNFPAGSVNVPVSISFTAANARSLMLLSSGADLVIKTNSSSSPGNTINLKSGIPLVWSASPGYFASPFTTDVTSWFVSCVGSTRLQALILSV